MTATDFFAVEIWTPRGLVSYYVLFVMHLSTRFVHIAGVTTSPNGAFMQQVARNLTDVSDGFLLNKAFLIMDRDTKYTDEFRAYLKREGVTPVLCPVRAPNCYAFAERFVRSIKPMVTSCRKSFKNQPVAKNIKFNKISWLAHYV